MAAMYDVTVDGGKYRFVYFDDGQPPQAYRHGERWEVREDSMIGDKALMALVARVVDLEQALNLALSILIQSEPSDSRAVSNEFVAMAAIHANLTDEAVIEESRQIITRTLASIEEGRKVYARARAAEAHRGD